MNKEQEQIDIIKRKIDYLKNDLEGLQEVYKYLRSNEARSIDIEYILDEIEADKEKIKKLEAELKAEKEKAEKSQCTLDER